MSRKAGTAVPRVVIVDDAAGFRRAARDLLERRGFKVVGEADSGAAALESVDLLAPDAVLLDVHLPDENGFEVAVRLKEARPDLAVLLTSATFDENFYRLSEVCGASGFVPKSELGRVELASFWPSANGRANHDDPA